MWGPLAGLPPRLALSGVTGPGRLCRLGSGAARRKDVPAGTSRGAHSRRKPSPDFGETCKHRFDPKRYITCPNLAKTLAKLMKKPQNPSPLVLECNPGPGFLTKALLESDHQVIALESDSTFIPRLKSLQKNQNGNLRVVHCDFFKLDPRNGGMVKPPIMISESLFTNLGIEPVPWAEGIPLRVFGMFPVRNEKKVLWKLLHDLYSCTSIFKYGRIELNVFVSEQEYQKLVANPKSVRFYQPLSVLWQVACDIKFLHAESCSSFDVCAQSGLLEKSKHTESLKKEQRMCFIRMTPRKDLFTESLTPINYDIFFHMIKQCFVKRNATLEDHLPSLSPIDAADIMKHLNTSEKSKITNMYPQDFKQLFEAIECSKDYTYKWLYDDFMEEIIL
ncbi:dimethyladenosine transferase 2, mitochondrial isoform X1 [Sorex fumeus]|uniref:dimethyladenosine transferase 2, mitochondrial isoform X1 n=1 Tax=Sorex fumeus TaxID=62283 RepID=UPI0024AE1D87|nr:dimethyladenosine transferase 2, mitochondrial isoform X1 [Sorex fumeus]